MRRRLAEETILFISILKWFVIASVVGVLVGLSTTAFLKVLRWSTTYADNYSYFFLLLPVAFFLSSFITKYLAPEAEGHGTEKVIEAIHRRSGHINVLVVPVKLFTTVVTLAAGGSAGKEGPCAQIGGGISSVLADIFKFDNADRKKLVICGISAGFASVFGTPIAGAIFGIEVLFIGIILYDVLLPSFIAGVIGYQVSAAFGIEYFYHPIKFVPAFSELFFAKVVLAGIFFGICSLTLIEGMKFFKKLADKITIWEPLKGVIGGTALVVLALIFSTKYLGLGLETIESALEGQSVAWWSVPVKIVFTCITLTFGGSGGMVTPLFFVGATAGSLFANLMGLDLATFAGIGMVCLLAGSANTPIAASILAVELFGPEVAPYAAVACVASFLMTGHRSVYPSQVLAMKKSSSIDVEMGIEVEEIKAKFQLRKRSLVRIVFTYWRKLFGR